MSQFPPQLAGQVQPMNAMAGVGPGAAGGDGGAAMPLPATSPQPAPQSDPARAAADMQAAQRHAQQQLRQQRAQQPAEVGRLQYWASVPNVAALLPDDVLTDLAEKVHKGYTIDDDSRTEWKEKIEQAMKVAKQVKDVRNYPFPNSSNIKYPLLATAAMQFNARAFPAIVNGREIAKVKLAGIDPQNSKAARGYRVASFINHQILDRMTSWDDDTDTLLSQIPITGSAFRKLFWNEDDEHADSSLISALNLVVHMKTKSLVSAPRITHKFELYRYEIEERQRAGVFLNVDVPQGDGDYTDDEAPVKFLEQHLYYDLDEDGYPEPWIVTIAEDSKVLVRIKACFDPNTIKFDQQHIIRVPKRTYFVHHKFLPDQEGGFYGIGFGQLLESMSEVIDTTFNQMLDAGHLQVAGGGFIGTGLNFEDEELYFEPGRYISVDAPGSVVRDAIVQNDFPGPSPVLFQLLGMITESAKQLTSVQDILTGASQSVMAQPTTVMALIDQGLKVFTAIYKRIYKALTCEFAILYEMIRDNVSDQDYSQFCGAEQYVQADFANDNYLVVPVADPSTVTEMQRMARAQFLASLLQGPFAQFLNPVGVLQRILNAASIDDVESIIAQPKPPSDVELMQKELLAAQIEQTKANTAHLWSLAGAEHSKGGLSDAKSAQIMLDDPIARINAQNKAKANAAA